MWSFDIYLIVKGSSRLPSLLENTPGLPPTGTCGSLPTTPTTLECSQCDAAAIRTGRCQYGTA